MPIENVRRYQIKRRVRSEGQEEQLRLACPFIEMGRPEAVSLPIVANSGAEGKWDRKFIRTDSGWDSTRGRGEAVGILLE